MPQINRLAMVSLKPSTGMPSTNNRLSGNVKPITHLANEQRGGGLPETDSSCAAQVVIRGMKPKAALRKDRT